MKEHLVRVHHDSTVVDVAGFEIEDNVYKEPKVEEDQEGGLRVIILVPIKSDVEGYLVQEENYKHHSTEVEGAARSLVWVNNVCFYLVPEREGRVGILA